MTGTAPTSPEPLEIRGQPRPVKRFSKRALMILFGTGSAVVLGSLGFALQGPRSSAETRPRELYNTGHNPEADGLAALPASYGDIKPDGGILGPPLPGDLGGPLLKALRDGRIEAPPDIGAGQTGMAFAPADVERMAQEAALSKEARTADVFFKGRSGEGRRGSEPVSYGAPAAAGSYAGLSALLPATGEAFGAAPDEDPNRQARKLGFLSETSDPTIYNPHRLETPVSPYQLMAGTIIPATLLTGVNSDLPGQVIAQVTEPVYDTVTGGAVLVPQGARLIGRYDSVIAFGQSRALLVWSRIVMPDGSSIRIDNLPGIDARGFAGLEDEVDYHGWKLLQGAALSTLLGVGSELASDDDGDVARAVRRSVQGAGSAAGEEIVRRQLDVQPTIKIRPGWRIGIMVNQDIVLKPYEGARSQ
jgi:type IV secretion system protein TrbI